MPLVRKKRESRDATGVCVMEGGRKKWLEEGVAAIATFLGCWWLKGVGDSKGSGVARHAVPEHGAIPGAALNESAFLCSAMLSKCKQHPIIYHPLRKQPPVNCHPVAATPSWSTPATSSPTVCTRGYRAKH